MIAIDEIRGVLTRGQSEWKRDILFFDAMAIQDHPESLFWDMLEKEDPDWKVFYREMEYLYSTPYFFKVWDFDDYPYIFSRAAPKLPLYEQDMRNWLRISELMVRKDLPEDAVATLHQIEVSMRLRLEAEFQTLGGMPSTVTRGLPVSLSGAPERVNPGDVLQLAIKRVPLPSELNSWEDIIALKSDKDVSERARKIMIWASEMADSGRSLKIIEQYLDDSIADYERYLKAHKIKFSSGLMSSVIVGTAGFLEDLIKLNIGKIAGRLFSARKMRADVLLSEMGAPGRAVSLVTVLNERLL